MNVDSQRLKKGLALTSLTLGLVLGGGMALATTAQAQQPYPGHSNEQQSERDGQWDHHGYNGSQDPYGNYQEYGYRRDHGRGYGRGNGRYERGYGFDSQVQKGFRDGFTRGQEDANDRRFFDPNNSSHFRRGTPPYREGFRRGYAQGYRQFRGYGRW